MNLPQIAIIILNWNGKQDTLDCLQSLTKVTYPNILTIVVDNGSSDDSVSAIQTQFPSVHLIANASNLGFAEGNNVGIRFALQTDAAFLFLLNNDTIVDPQILTSFLNHFNLHPDAGILGAKICLFNDRTTLDHWGGNWNAKKGHFDLIGHRQQENTPPPDTIDYVCGAAFMTRRTVWETIGLLEPQFFLIWEESDFCFRARKQGFKILTCPQAIIWHKVSASFVSKPHSTYFWWRNRLLWIERNCTTPEKLSLYFRVLLPEISHLLKTQLLKSLQLHIRKRLSPHTPFTSQQEKLKKNRAALQGVLDYTFRRFGNAPSWIYKP